VDSAEGLKALVAKGTTSYEFRPFMIHPQDVPAFLLATCNGPAPFFAISEQMFAQQQSWLGKSSSITEEDQKSLQNATPLQVAALLAQRLELDKFVQQRGVPASKAKMCIADQKALDGLAKVSEKGVEQFKVAGTPTFILNGQVQEGATGWDAIEPLLKAAGA
jgi:protein-disulfide isomerase